MKKIKIPVILSYVVLILCVIVALFPYLWTFLPLRIQFTGF